MAVLSSAPDSIAETGAGAFAMRVGQPRVHRREADFRAVADQDEKERQRHELRIEARGRVLQNLPGHVVGRPDHERAAPIEQHRSEQGEAYAGRDDDNVFPRGLDARRVPFERDEKGADQGRELDGDPVEAGVVHHRSDQRAETECRKHRIEARKARLLAEEPHVADGVDGREEIHDRGAEDRPRSKPVDDDVSVPEAWRGA